MAVRCTQSIFIFAAVALLTEAGRAADTRPASVLLILADGIGTGDLSGSGNPLAKTPRLERLAKESVRFTDFHAAPLAVPARAALLTGRVPARSGIWSGSGGRSHLAAPILTLPGALNKAGWRCGVFGTWGLGDAAPCRPADHGFGFSRIHRGPRLGSAADAWDNDGTDDIVIENGETVRATGWCMDVWRSAAVDFLTKYRGPGFCLLAPAALPDPGVRPTEKDSSDGEDAPVSETGFTVYAAEVDRVTGAALDALENAGALDATLIIFTSTTGTAGGWDEESQKGYNKGLRGSAGSPAEGGHRVPMLMRWPDGGIGGPGKGRDVTVTASLTDLLPTLASLCSAPLPADAGLDGRSLVPLLRSDAAPGPEWNGRILLTDAQDTPQIIPWRRSAVMQGTWRLLHGRELYRLDTDPGQRADIAALHPEMTASLRAAGETIWKELAAPPPPVAWTVENTPLHLTAQDWHARGGRRIETRQDIESGVRAHGHWPISVAAEGDWTITLRRWPPGVKRDPAENFFTPSRARVLAGKTEQFKAMETGALEAVFIFRLPAGISELRASFEGPEGDSCGAYFVTIAPLVKEAEAAGKKKKRE